MRISNIPEEVNVLLKVIIFNNFKLMFKDKIGLIFKRYQS